MVNNSWPRILRRHLEQNGTDMYNPQINTFRQRRPLELNDIGRYAPSAFAREAHESRSARYIYIPTHSILEALYREGWRAYSAGQGRCRIPGKSDYTKHWIVLRHPDMLPDAVGDTFPEMRLANGHDGTSAYRLEKGLHKVRCLNGMIHHISGEDDIVRVKHSGNLDRIRGEVVEGSFRIMGAARKAMGDVDRMAQTQLPREYQYRLAEAAQDLVWPDGAPVNEDQLLRERRPQDRGNDLWLTFNRLQENIISGGLAGRNASGARTTTREVKSLERDAKINRGLFALAYDVGIIANGTPEEKAALGARLEAERALAQREEAESGLPVAAEGDFELA